MQGVRFYLEFPDVRTKKRSGKWNKGHCGNVFAAFYPDQHDGLVDGLGAILNERNSPIASTSASREFLAQCKRIPEWLARAIHPRMFEWLDKG